VARPQLLAVRHWEDRVTTAGEPAGARAVLYLRVLSARTGQPLYTRQIASTFTTDTPDAETPVLPRSAARSAANEVSRSYFERVAGSRQSCAVPRGDDPRRTGSIASVGSSPAPARAPKPFDHEYEQETVYAQPLEVPEYSYLDLQRGELRLGQLIAGRYEWLTPDADGRLWSPQFDSAARGGRLRRAPAVRRRRRETAPPAGSVPAARSFSREPTSDQVAVQMIERRDVTLNLTCRHPVAAFTAAVDLTVVPCSIADVVNVYGL